MLRRALSERSVKNVIWSTRREEVRVTNTGEIVTINYIYLVYLHVML